MYKSETSHFIKKKHQDNKWYSIISITTTRIISRYATHKKYLYEMTFLFIIKQRSDLIPIITHNVWSRLIEHKDVLSNLRTMVHTIILFFVYYSEDERNRWINDLFCKVHLLYSRRLTCVFQSTSNAMIFFEEQLINMKSYMFST